MSRLDLNVFVDFHHGDLYYALHKLFEERLGCHLYRPVGMDWYERGYWHIGDPYDTPHETAEQFLGMSESYKSLGAWFDQHQPSQDFNQHCVTMGDFQAMDFDIIISSHTLNDASYADLTKKFQPQATHISHVGNNDQNTTIPFVITSVDPKRLQPVKGQKVVYCRQEFDQEIFRYQPPTYEGTPKIKSFISPLGANEEARELFLDVEQALPSFDFKMHGNFLEDRDGNVSPLAAIAQKMRESLWGWSVIAPGFLDGLGGHIFQNWIASGRPLIVRMEDFEPFPNSPILQPGKNCLDITGMDVEGIASTIRTLSEPENHLQMCRNMKEVADRVIDFERDERNIRAFLEEIGVRP